VAHPQRRPGESRHNCIIFSLTTSSQHPPFSALSENTYLVACFFLALDRLPTGDSLCNCPTRSSTRTTADCNPSTQQDMGASPHRHIPYRAPPYLKYIITIFTLATLMLFWSLRPSRYLDFNDESDTGIFSQRKMTEFELSQNDD
jgi:hypothetical protein